MEKLKGNIFLIEPKEDRKYKTLIVYSDTAENARISANQKYHPKDTKSNKELVFSDEKLVYLNKDFSICREIKPKITFLDNDLDFVKIEYKGVAYKLERGKPQECIISSWI